jgi:type II secretory pathway pseudopilin PulG
MEILIVLGIVAALAAGAIVGRKTFAREIDRAKRIRRSNRKP